MVKNKKRPSKGYINRVLILESTKSEVIVVFDYMDGTAGVASTYCEDGYLRTEYYQDRVTKHFTHLFEDLSYGKQYMKDWDGSDDKHPHKSFVDNQVIDDAVNWLSAGCSKYHKTIKKPNQWNNPLKAIKSFIKQA